MPTKAKFKEGEGKLKYFNPEIGCVTRRMKMEDNDMCIENDQAFQEAFYQMADRVEKLFVYYERKMAKEGKKEGALVDDNVLVHQGGRGEPPKSPSSSSIYSSSPHSHHSNSH